MLNIQTAAMRQLQATLAEFSPAEQSLVQSIEEQLAIGKKHALKKYDQFALNTCCFWGSTRSNITSGVQFHQIIDCTRIMNKLIYYYCWSKNFVKSEVIFFVTTKISWNQNLKIASASSSITPIKYFAFPYIAIQQQIAIILRAQQKQAQTSLQIIPNNEENAQNCKESQENVCDTVLETQCTISPEEKCSEINCVLVEEEDCQLVQVSN